MKKIFFIANLLLVYHFTFCQKDFEGTIKYKIISSELIPAKDTGSLNISFYQGKIRIENYIENNSKSSILVIIDSGKTYTFYNDEKTYSEKRLHTIGPIKSAQKMAIAGYNTTPTLQESYFPMNFGNVTVWYADELHFTVPEKYRANEELLMIGNNKIMLRAVIGIPDIRSQDDEQNSEKYTESQSSQIVIEAFQILPGIVNPADFTIQADYKIGFNDIYLKDSVYNVVVDTAQPMIGVPLPPKLPASKNKTKKPSKKQSAYNRDMKIPD